MAHQPLLDIRDLSILLDLDDGALPVVQDVSFALEPGKVLALVGESGCGKSVTSHAILRILPRELTIATGRIHFRAQRNGEAVDLAGLDPNGKAIRDIRGTEIAMIFQEPMSSFSPLHTIGNQIAEVPRLHRKMSKHEARDLTASLLEKVGIPHPDRAVDQYPHEFSGGMRQRAMIAKALSCNPSLLIADEPTTALDVTIQAQILELMRNLLTELGMAIIFITHDLGTVAQMADEVAIMYTGRIVEQGSVREIFHNPKHPYTVNLIRAIPKLGDLRARRTLAPIQGTVPGLSEMPSGCTFHPRCSSFIEGKCELAFPVRTEVTAGHTVCCHLYEECPTPEGRAHS